MVIHRMAQLGALLCFLAGAAGDARADEKGTYLGALFMSRAQDAPAKPGAVITFVLPDSPASKAQLRRNDILLGYNKKAIRDGDHLAHLIRTDKPGNKVSLLVQRGERRQEVEVTLALGTALKPAEAEAGRGRGQGAPAQVSVWATPLSTGQVNFTVMYYTAEGNRKTLSCDEPARLAAELKKLPERERNLVGVALQRLKSYSEAKGAAEKARKK